MNRSWISKKLKSGSAAQEHIQANPTEVVLNTYEELYEAHAQSNPLSLSVGGGDYEIIGRAELEILRHFGLKNNSTLFDFGCGTGRLGRHAIEFLNPGNYYGSDISETMLREFRNMVETDRAFTLFHQRDDFFPALSKHIDVFAAFSVFTHMEMEDTYRYLCNLKAITDLNSIAVISLIDYDSKLGQQIFLEQASLPHDPRWNGVRSFCTSRDSFEMVAELSGWQIEKWIHGDDKRGIPKLNSSSEFWEFGQSVVLLRRS